MIWLSVRVFGLLLTRAWGLIVIGLVLAGIGGWLFPSQNGATITLGYTRGCIKEHTYTQDGSSHMLTLGSDQPATMDNCPTDASQAGIGYQFTTSDLSPAFPPTIQESGVVLVEIWYQPGLSSGTCGSSDAPRSCQIASVVAVRTYTADGSGNLVAGTLYKTDNFSIAGDLTQQGYTPTGASYTNGSVILPISLLGAGLLVLGGGIVWLIFQRMGRRSSRPARTQALQGSISLHMNSPAGRYSQSVYSQPPGYSQPTYQQPGYSQPIYPQQPPGNASQPGYAQPAYPQQPGGGQRPNQGP